MSECRRLVSYLYPLIHILETGRIPPLCEGCERDPCTKDYFQCLQDAHDIEDDRRQDDERER
jgi:hypothetical protein